MAVIRLPRQYMHVNYQAATKTRISSPEKAAKLKDRTYLISCFWMYVAFAALSVGLIASLIYIPSFKAQVIPAFIMGYVLLFFKACEEPDLKMS